MKTEEFQTTKLWKQTLRKLKMIAALTDSSMVEVAERLISDELGRLVGGNILASVEDSPD